MSRAEDLGQEPVGSDADGMYDPLKELEESMPQGVPNATYGRRSTDAVDTDLSSLDELLNSSLEAKKVEEQYKADREARKRNFVGMSKEEVDFCNSRMHAFEMAREWEADRCVAVFVQNECTHCGAVRTLFSRLMEHHNHRFTRGATRWITVSKSSFTFEPVLEVREQPMCISCMHEFDIPADPVQWPWFNEVVMQEEHQDD